MVRRPQRDFLWVARLARSPTFNNPYTQAMTEDELNFQALLSGLTDRQIREFCIEAVRRVREKGDRASTIRLDPTTIQYELVAVLCEHRGQDQPPTKIAPLLFHLLDDWATPILEFFVWLERAGLAFRYGGTTQEPVQRIRLLPAGLTFFDSKDDAHPFVPGWLERVKQRCAQISNDTFDLIVDSHECFEHGLLRASVALLGVAFESVIDDAYNAMIAAGLQLPRPNPNKAAQRLTSVRAGAAMKFPGNSNRDARRSAEQACDFADRLRQRRNDASHRKAAFAFGDRQEVEELLLLAALELPALHSLL